MAFVSGLTVEIAMLHAGDRQVTSERATDRNARAMALV